MTFAKYDVKEKSSEKMQSSWKDNFKSGTFLPVYNNPSIFVMSQWQPDKNTPSILYLVLRLAIFLTFFIIWILSYTKESDDGQRSWPVYLTNWGLTICTIQSFLASLMLTCCIISVKVLDTTQLSDSVLRAYSTYWVCNSIATTVAFTISIVYWTLIHQPEYWTIMNFMVHGMNSILMFIDFCVVAHPVNLMHLIYPVCFAFVYVTMTAIYYACGGLAKDGSKYIYPILKWDEPGVTVLYCIAILILITVIHVCTFGLYKGRVKIAQLCFGDNESDSMSDNESTMLPLY